ncbi:MAG: apolipoprotein N-acyltransferase [Candidatus Competibacteraceae bacterium]|nr:apolipoprotein N-acyltransferase [Candidatus Competibacteraceae bacterium]
MKRLVGVQLKRLRLSSPATQDGLALAGGALLPLAFSPFDLWPLAIPLVALLLWLWQAITPRRAAWRGGLFGIGVYTVGISWVYISLHDYGNAPVVFAALATALLILVMAAYPALLGYVLVRWGPRTLWLSGLLVAPALWVGLEWVRSWLFTGFPWLAIGYSQIDGPLSGLATYFGLFGVSWAVVFSAGALLLLIQGKRSERLIGGLTALLLWIGAWGLGTVNWVELAGEPLRVSLVQGNIPQERKFRPEQLENTLVRYAELSLDVASDSDVIIWPETAIPVFFQDAQDFIQHLEVEAVNSGVDYLIGVPSGSWETEIFHNSVFSLGGEHGFYHKHRLLPFGEYLPLRWLLTFFHRLVDIPMADFTPGGTDQALLRVAGQPVGVSICFEAVFGSEIRRTLPESRFLVNVSNDAWFGRSLAPYQHLQIARMRALEMGRAMARATNTGVSAMIDERGRITAQSQLFKTQVVQGLVQPLRGTTPYVILGDGVVLLLLCVSLAVGLGLGRRFG